MELTLLAARLLLAAVFLLAGAAKLADLEGSSKAFIGFGLPRRLALVLSLLLAPAEILVAVALIPVALAWYGACGALALLCIFIIGIGINLARGRKPDCHCFGQLHSAPVGWTTLVRNGILAAAAGWLVFRGPAQVGPSLWKHLASAGDNERRFFIFGACVMCLLLFRALKRKEQAQPERVDEPESVEESAQDPESDRELPSPVTSSPRRAPLNGNGVPHRPPAPKVRPEVAIPRPLAPLSIGAPAPPFELATVSGGSCSLRSLLEQKKIVLLIFSSPYCDSCRAVAPNIGNWMREHAQSLDIFVISRGTVQDNLTKLKNLEASRILLQPAFELSDAYGVSATPAAVLIGSDGLIRSNLVVGGVEIKELISSSLKLLVKTAGEERAAHGDKDAPNNRKPER
jgi:peroxiredoxin/uncharacterized membrane protein YphA (DoxX/SURF4 family)